MKAVSDGLYRRGKHGNMYVRRRIPAAIRAAYPQKQTHVIRSLGTADYRTAKPLAHAELAKIAAEFELKRQQIDLSRASKAVKRIRKLSDQQLQDFARFWMHQVLLTDEQNRQQGLDDDEFEELGERLTAQRAELGRMLAQGKTSIFPALHGFLYLCGLDFDPGTGRTKQWLRISKPPWRLKCPLLRWKIMPRPITPSRSTDSGSSFSSARASAGWIVPVEQCHEAFAVPGLDQVEHFVDYNVFQRSLLL